jgi:ribosomal protein S18 acetylase RimI-like enzyme
MAAEVTFRRYQESDHDAVWRVFAACTAQLGFRHGPWDDDMHHITAVFLNSGGEFIVGECEHRIVALGGLQPDGPARAEVRRIGVHPDSQRQGFGQALMAELESRARWMGVTSLHLDTSITQIAAQKLYRKCGYREAGHVVKSGVECILYQKDL